MLAPGHGQPTGMWSDGWVLLIAHDPDADGADDALFAYNLVEDGERAPEAEWELEGRNRAPRGVAGAGEVVWVADSGHDRLFAYDREGGEPLPARDIRLDARNSDARGIWSGAGVVYVLDGVPAALHAYDVETGAPLGRHGLDPANGDPRGLWCDGAACWVSDPGAPRVFAYRLPSDPAADGPLERARGEEFDGLAEAGNGSPRGIWSDGALLYVADVLDRGVYTYDMPASLDARLSSLTLSDVDIGDFSPLRTEYRGDALALDVVTTVRTEARPGASVAIEPPDPDGDAANGHQVALGEGVEIAITVTSPDGSRTRAYRVLAGGSCLRGEVSRGFSLVVHAGGAIPGLDACTRGRNVTALYTRREGRWVAWIAGAPEFVNGPFAEAWGLPTPAGPVGIPAGTPLLAASGGPPSAGSFPGGAAAPRRPWRACLRGDVARGQGGLFSLVLFEGGSVEALGACARARGVDALYAIGGAGWVSYLVDATEGVNRRFVELFPDGLPLATPLVARTTSPRPNGPAAGD
ncbi:MAG: hypothetical protein OXC94_02915 [Chloroflexi bacterium]|nr:hypothetical protein [Chloroflexota bacterium]